MQGTFVLCMFPFSRIREEGQAERKNHILVPHRAILHQDKLLFFPRLSSAFFTDVQA